MAYLEDYLDTFEALPIEVTKQMTLLKELGKKKCSKSCYIDDLLSNSVVLDSKCFQSVKKSKKSTLDFLKNIKSLNNEDKKREMLRLTVGGV